jgi:hypothetical protein
VFTVGGAVAGLVVSKEYAWVGGLFLLTGLCALTAFAYQKHKDLLRAKKEHQAEKRRIEEDVRNERTRAENAERRLREVPSDILLRLEATIRAHAFAELAEVLGRHADYVARMTRLAEALTRPITLRTFVKRAGMLFVDAKLDPDPIGRLRQDDPFLLEFKNPGGLTTASALLQVHQLEAAKELVWFRVGPSSGEEIARVDALAEKQEVPAKGYTARPVCDPTRYAGANLDGAAPLIRDLTDEITRLRSQA